jgi:hypothetical protein
MTGHDRRDALVAWMRLLADRLQSVRVLCTDWSRAVNTHYGTHGGGICAVFFDPPYKGYENLYADRCVATDVESWCRDHSGDNQVRIVLAGHIGDYDLPGWRVVPWSRRAGGRGPGYAGSMKTMDSEALWLSPGCLDTSRQLELL